MLKVHMYNKCRELILEDQIFKRMALQESIPLQPPFCLLSSYLTHYKLLTASTNRQPSKAAVRPDYPLRCLKTILERQPRYARRATDPVAPIAGCPR